MNEIDAETVRAIKKLAGILRADPSKCNDERLKAALATISKAYEESQSTNTCFPFWGAGPPAAETGFTTAQLGAGCYLLETPANNGTLVACWSESRIEGALAFTSPGREVPKFKFSTNGGKSEIVRGIGARGSRVAGVYYHGWLDFLRNYVKGFDGSLVLLAPTEATSASGGEAEASSACSSSSSSPYDDGAAAATAPSGPVDVGVFLHMGEGKRVKALRAHEPLDDLAGVDGVAVGTSGATAYAGIEMTSTIFAEKGKEFGASVLLFGAPKL